MSGFEDPDSLEVVPGFDDGGLEGAIPSIASEADLREALHLAFDYRGDVTITRKDGAIVEGYLYDRSETGTLAECYIRVWAKDSDERVAIPYSDIAGLVFSGRDTAAGRGWEVWLRQYWSKKSAGETRIERKPEPLD